MFFAKDLTDHHYENKDNVSYYNFYTYMRNTYIKYNNERSIGEILKRHKEDEIVAIKITNLIANHQ